MKNLLKLFGVVALVAIIGFSMAACGEDDDDPPAGGNPPGEDPSTVVYTGEDIAGNTYTLTITRNANRAVRYAGAEGDSYELVIYMKDGTVNVSRGTIENVSADGTFTLQPSYEEADTFSIVISEEKISSVTGAVTIEDEDGEVTSMSVSTFDTIYLRAGRWVNNYTGDYGEQWHTGHCVKISDFIDEDIIGKTYKVTISGTVDKDLKHPGLAFVFMKDGYWHGHLGTGDLTAIDAGDFKRTATINVAYPTDVDPDTLDGTEEPFAGLGEVINAHADWGYDYGTIPEDIPEGYIMATISNFFINIEKYVDE